MMEILNLRSYYTAQLTEVVEPSSSSSRLDKDLYLYSALLCSGLACPALTTGAGGPTTILARQSLNLLFLSLLLLLLDHMFGWFLKVTKNV